MGPYDIDDVRIVLAANSSNEVGFNDISWTNRTTNGFSRRDNYEWTKNIIAMKPDEFRNVQCCMLPQLNFLAWWYLWVDVSSGFCGVKVIWDFSILQCWLVDVRLDCHIKLDLEVVVNFRLFPAHRLSHYRRWKESANWVR